MKRQTPSSLPRCALGAAWLESFRQEASVSDNPLDLAICALGAQRDRDGCAGTVAPEPAVASIEGRDQLALLARRFAALAVAVIRNARCVGVRVVIDVMGWTAPAPR